MASALCSFRTQGARTRIRHVAQVKKERWAEGCVVKDRAEPCHVSRVLRVVAASRGADEADVGAQAFANSARLFRLGVD